jgi:P27 family predicted phage terminase small subunit
MGGLGSGPLSKGSGKVKRVKRLNLPPGYPTAVESNFRWLATQLEGHNIAKVDVFAIADMAFYMWQKTEAMAQLVLEGITIPDEAHGKEARKHPALTVYRQADMQFQRLAIQFGMTPASRARLLLNDKEEHDPYEEFRNGNAPG